MRSGFTSHHSHRGLARAARNREALAEASTLLRSRARRRDLDRTSRLPLGLDAGVASHRGVVTGAEVATTFGLADVDLTEALTDRLTVDAGAQGLLRPAARHAVRLGRAGSARRGPGLRQPTVTITVAERQRSDRTGLLVRAGPRACEHGGCEGAANDDRSEAGTDHAHRVCMRRAETRDPGISMTCARRHGPRSDIDDGGAQP